MTENCKKHNMSPENVIQTNQIQHFFFLQITWPFDLCGTQITYLASKLSLYFHHLLSQTQEQTAGFVALIDAVTDQDTNHI